MVVLRTLALAAVLIALPALLFLRRAPERPPNALVITVESLRTDHVGFQGGTRDTTPNLDKLAAEATVYDNAHSVTSWTLTSHASLFTGLYPSAHRTVKPLDRLDDSYETLAETLAGHGYQTAAVVSGPYLRRPHNLHQGFESYDEGPASSDDVAAHDDVTNPAMLEGLVRFLREERDPARPFFLFAYFWDPHYDYIPPEPWDRMFVDAAARPVDVRGFGTSDRIHAGSPREELAWVEAQYDGEIAWTDRTLADLFDALGDLGLWDDTVVVVTSDHGEEFFEHGKKGHKNNLFVESVHVPLLVKYPGRAAARDARPASLVDLYPTILELTGAATDAPLHGRSLLEADPDPERPIFFELVSTWYTRKDADKVEERVQDWRGVLAGSHKLVGVPDKRMWLFDVGRDAGEREDLMRDPAPHVPTLRRLAGLLQRFDAEMAATREFFDEGGAAEVDPAQIERLRSLGYIR